MRSFVSPQHNTTPFFCTSISCFISQTQKKTFARRFAPCLELPYHEQPGSARAGHPSPCPYPPPIIRIEASRGATLGPPSPPLFPADVGGAQKTSGTTSARSCNRQCVGRKKGRPPEGTARKYSSSSGGWWQGETEKSAVTGSVSVVSVWHETNGESRSIRIRARPFGLLLYFLLHCTSRRESKRASEQASKRARRDYVCRHKEDALIPSDFFSRSPSSRPCVLSALSLSFAASFIRNRQERLLCLPLSIRRPRFTQAWDPSLAETERHL